MDAKEIYLKNETLLKDYEAKLKAPNLTEALYIDTVSKVVKWSDSRRAYYNQVLELIIRVATQCYHSLRKVLRQETNQYFQASDFQFHGNQAALIYCELIANLRRHYDCFSGPQKANIKNILLPSVPFEIEEMSASAAMPQHPIAGPSYQSRRVVSDQPMAGQHMMVGPSASATPRRVTMGAPRQVVMDPIRSQQHPPATIRIPPRPPRQQPGGMYQEPIRRISQGSIASPLSGSPIVPSKRPPPTQGPSNIDGSTQQQHSLYPPPPPNSAPLPQFPGGTPPPTQDGREPPNKRLKLARAAFDLDKRGLQKVAETHSAATSPIVPMGVPSFSNAVGHAVADTSQETRDSLPDNAMDVDSGAPHSMDFEMGDDAVLPPPPTSAESIRSSRASSVDVPLALRLGRGLLPRPRSAAHSVASEQLPSRLPSVASSVEVPLAQTYHAHRKQPSEQEDPQPDEDAMDDAPPPPTTASPFPEDPEAQPDTHASLILPKPPPLQLSTFMADFFLRTTKPREAIQFPVDSRQLCTLTPLFSYDKKVSQIKTLLNFTLDAEQMKGVKKWLELNEKKNEQDVSDCLCVTIASYERAAMESGFMDVSFQSQLPTLDITCKWSQQNEMSLRASFQGERALFPISPPIMVTYDGLLDASPFIVEGDNAWKVEGSLINYLLLCRIHPPTTGMISEFRDACRKQQDRVTRRLNLNSNLTIGFIPFEPQTSIQSTLVS